jgi:plasmid stabilization system protein ParE
MRVELSGLGRRRLHEICAYIADRNPAAAVRVRQRIVASLDLLSEHPLAGPRWRDTDTRALMVPGLRYRIHYEITKDGVRVLTILHTSQKPPSGF